MGTPTTEAKLVAVLAEATTLAKAADDRTTLRRIAISTARSLLDLAADLGES